MLQVTDLRLGFVTGKALLAAVDGVSFAVSAGETFALLGESGCGKSVTAQGIMRLRPPAGHVGVGSVRLAGEELLTLPEAEMRRLRGETLKLRELEYIQAAQAFGVSSWRIIIRHILPNLMHIVIIALVMDFSGLVLAEAVLSYVGIGVDPTMISFGTMINSARMELGREPVVWWSLAAAFIAMFILVLAANLFADAVRDAFDPRAA